MEFVKQQEIINAFVSWWQEVVQVAFTGLGKMGWDRLERAWEGGVLSGFLCWRCLLALEGRGPGQPAEAWRLLRRLAGRWQEVAAVGGEAGCGGPRQMKPSTGAFEFSNLSLMSTQSEHGVGAH